MPRNQGSRVSTRKRGPLAHAAVVAVLLGALAACGGPRFHYVANSQNHNFFKVPTDWNLRNVTDADKEGRPAEMQDGIVTLWHTAFDNAPAPSQPTVNELKLPEQVVGDAKIYSISTSNRERLSMSAVRAMAFGYGVDPLFPPDDLAPRVGLVDYQDRVGGEGSGSRVIANFNLADDASQPPRWVTLDVTFLLDTRTNRIFSLKMGCASTCYLQNRAAIDEIAASWTVKS